jgi:chromosome segregation ATPase
MPRHTLAIALFGLSALAAGSAWTQTQRSGGGEAQRFMQQYQQLAQEKTALQTQLAQMKKDLDASKADLAAMTKERDALKAHVRAGVPAAAMVQLTASKETAERNLEQYKQRTTELINRFREMAANLKDVESDRNTLRTDLAQRNAAFDKCAGDNLQLFEITNSVLDRYEHVGVFTRVSTAEPFTKITRTRVENLVDEYRERALQLREKKTNGSPASGAPSNPQSNGAPSPPASASPSTATVSPSISH